MIEKHENTDVGEPFRPSNEAVVSAVYEHSRPMDSAATRRASTPSKETTAHLVLEAVDNPFEIGAHDSVDEFICDIEHFLEAAQSGVNEGRVQATVSGHCRVHNSLVVLVLQ